MPMSIFKRRLPAEAFHRPMPNTLMHSLGIELLEQGDDFLRGRMPVDGRTHQPMGLLHGGASVALAETLGSHAAFLCLESAEQGSVGLEINANHLRAVRSGWVYGVARAIHLGRSTHVWEIRITDETDKLVCVSRLTMSILDRPTPSKN
jgi:1,4-dihydroxy-2-naphthoyl-CoA hydrolase